jgi:hypothetical protein
MRRVLCLIVVGALLGACGNSPTTNSPPPTPYRVTVFSSTNSTNPAGDKIYTVVLKAVDKTTGDPVPNHEVILQVSVGTTNPTLPTTDGTGTATVSWTILKADQTPGQSEAMAFCAPGPGQSFCQTNLSGPDAFVVGPF